MVSIHGLPPALVQNQKVQKQQAVGKNNQVKKANGSKAMVAQPSKVATAVTNQVKQLNASEYANSRLQYDLPEGGIVKQWKSIWILCCKSVERNLLSSSVSISISSFSYEKD